MKKTTLLALVIASLLAGCASDPAGTTVSGSVQLSRTSGSETGQTGFVFPDATFLEENPFYGSCTMEDTGDGLLLSLQIDRAAPDAFGLASFSLELPADKAYEPGSAKVSAVAGGTTFADSTGSCEVLWSAFDPSSGRADVRLDCGAMSGGAPTETVTLAVDLAIDGCK